MPSEDTPSLLKKLLAAQDRAMVDALVGGPTYDEATGQIDPGPAPLTWAALLQLEQDVQAKHKGE